MNFNLHPDFHIRPFQPADQDAVIELWRQCGLVAPRNDPAADIARKSQVQPELFMVGSIRGQIVATLMAGYDGHRGWLNYLAVAPEFRRRGLGRRLVAFAEAALKHHGCPKINLQVRETNREVLHFYERLGYRTDRVVSLGKRLA